MITTTQINLVSYKKIYEILGIFINFFLTVNPNEKILQIDSDDECKDVVGETAFMKQMAAVRNSTILHSVEDLSTDSTWVYKTRSGFDSNRGSKKR